MTMSATFECKITNGVPRNPRNHSSTVQACVRVCVILCNFSVHHCAATFGILSTTVKH